MTQARPPGWYPDEHGTTRYWNGIGWATVTPPPADPGVSPTLYGTSPLPALDPLGAPPPPWYRRTGFVVSAVIVGVLIVAGVVVLATSSSKHGSNSPQHSSTGATSPAAPPSGTSAAPGRSFRMPNEVGRVLQTAQDDLQRLSGNPLFVSRSHDLLGARFQILDRDWKVCDQSVAPGRMVAVNADIDFGVVKLDETCP